MAGVTRSGSILKLVPIYENSLFYNFEILEDI